MDYGIKVVEVDPETAEVRGDERLKVIRALLFHGQGPALPECFRLHETCAFWRKLSYSAEPRRLVFPDRVSDWHFLNMDPPRDLTGVYFVNLNSEGPAFSIEQELGMIRNPELIDRPREMFDLAREVLARLNARRNENVADWSTRLANDVRDVTD